MKLKKVNPEYFSANRTDNRPLSYSTKEPGSSAIFYTILYARFDRAALEALSLLCTFENSSNCIIASFDLDSFLEKLKVLLSTYVRVDS